MKIENLNKSCTALLNKKLILYPTDTIWGIGCDATDFSAVNKVYQLKERPTTKSLIVLVSSIKMLKKYVEEIPSEIESYLNAIKKPVTVIYSQPKNLASNCIAQDNTIAIRIVSEGFVHKLITKFGKPIVSTSANKSGAPFPKEFSEIENSILKGVDYIVTSQPKNVENSASKIVQISADGKIHVIRP